MLIAAPHHSCLSSAPRPPTLFAPSGRSPCRRLLASSRRLPQPARNPASVRAVGYFFLLQRANRRIVQTSLSSLTRRWPSSASPSAVLDTRSSSIVRCHPPELLTRVANPRATSIVVYDKSVRDLQRSPFSSTDSLSIFAGHRQPTPRTLITTLSPITPPHVVPTLIHRLPHILSFVLFGCVSDSHSKPFQVMISKMSLMTVGTLCVSPRRQSCTTPTTRNFDFAAFPWPTHPLRRIKLIYRIRI